LATCAPAQWLTRREESSTGYWRLAEITTRIAITADVLSGEVSSNQRNGFSKRENKSDQWVNGWQEARWRKWVKRGSKEVKEVQRAKGKQFQ